ncbi:unnamed protein product [Triticum turgidum subsp. durum]|uniref:Uncharacterized protein n=1 Tax=Triticum turgidum subsp. durum TaxID=4567 RepID=A0A9R0PYD7_TRITD|nr:unnamed protein product [Triticum turgidum subsp. durum]
MAAPSPAVAAVSSAPSSGLLPARRAAPCSAVQVQLPSIRRAAPGGRMATVARAVGDVGAEGNTYLIAGAGFVRKSGSTLRANAARKDQAQIVCANCNGLGKLGQIDK